MSIQTETFKSGDFTYTIRQFGTTQGARVMVRLMRGVVGPALGGVLGTLAATKPGSKIDLGKLDISGAVKEITDRLTEEDFEFVAAAIVGCTEVRGTTPETTPLAKVYEVHFIGRYDDLLALLWKGLVLNYRSFFDALGKARRAAEALQEQTASPVGTA